MSTTTLVAEVVVIGAFALVWVALFVFRFFGLDSATVSSWFTQYKDWSTGITLIAIAISYQLGWSVNQLSYFIARKTFNKMIKSKIFKNEYQNYDSIKTTVFMKGSPFMLDKIRERLSVVRLTRSACLNLLLISVGFFTLGQWYLGLIALGITVLFYIQANDIYTLYCRHIFNAYETITQDSQNAEKRLKDESDKSKTTT